ncbi:hypothetical protein B0H13DRAFT_1589410 [Mycena leptocephala]|nr:hypothetical protein B0H13DRAFT_1589410 [Mycena leptocephala]
MHVLESGLRYFSHPPDVVRSNQTLMRQGYIGGSPQKPAIAFAIRTLEIYRQIHRVCPRYTIDSLAKTLSHLHKVPRKVYLAEQLTTAYDAYLAIQREVEVRVQRTLGRDEAWDWKHVCPPCFYKAKDEPRLKLSYLGSLDGNNSVKLVDSTFRAGHPRFDNRTLRGLWGHNYNLDARGDEFPDGPAATDDASPDADGDFAWLNVNELNPDDVDSLQKCVNTCVERWKAAGPEAWKKMFALFAISGIFISVCRHGHVLVMCDMIRSVELMKYPLAIVSKLFERYGADTGIGYDIMCAFFKTLLRSSLGKKTVGLRMRGIVPAFHGHAHNRMCQLGWHPMYVEGAGLEDFEECECTFCLSNNLASCTRLATPFHRQQQIDEHFYFHDLDKHAASGNFIFQNYRQAIEKITANRLKLNVLEDQLHTSAADYEQDLKDERAHLESLLNEPAEVQKTRDFKNLDHLIINQGFTRKEIALVKTRYRTTWERLTMVDEETARFEEHAIEKRWTSTTQEYIDGLVLTNERRYRRAIDKLERLVVQRLLELTKLSMSAYKLRDKIGKALKTRTEAIHRALVEYNGAAAMLNSPRDPLVWARVIETVSLAEFDLLRDTHTDIRRLPWTQPARREAGLLYFGIKRANEEIQRLNVEITRIITFAVDPSKLKPQRILRFLLANLLKIHLDMTWRRARPKPRLC